MPGRVFLVFFALTLRAAAATSAGDASYEGLAYRLELVRNQIELTISNHRSLHGDLGKQGRDLEGLGVFLRIPKIADDARADRDLLHALRAAFEKAARLETGFKVRRLKLAGPWKSAPARVPRELPFDTDYQLPPEQIADSRLVSIELEFEQALPVDPSYWLSGIENTVARLLVPVRWTRSGRRLGCLARIFRFRELAYPKMLAPDLSRFELPAAPRTPSQKAAARRIETYRREIRSLWPRAQPLVDDIGAFAVNDARMNFYVGHAKLHVR